MHDFRLLLWCKGDLCCLWISRGVEWQFHTDIKAQQIVPKHQ